MQYDLAETRFAEMLKEALGQDQAMPNLAALDALETALEHLGLGPLVRIYLKSNFEVDHLSDLNPCDMACALTFLQKVQTLPLPGRATLPLPAGAKLEGEMLWVNGRMELSGTTRK